MTLSIEVKIVILGAGLYKGTKQETSRFIHIIFEGRIISSVSAKFTYSEILGLRGYRLYVKLFG